jgi:branched-chain amino acid transport system permease protein
MRDAPRTLSGPGRRAGIWYALTLTAAGLAFMPQTLPPYLLILLCYALILALACLGLNLLLGTSGLLSLGHAAFFGMGAYGGAFLYRFWNLESLELFLLCGVVGSTLLAAALGYLCTRATRIHFTILSLALAQGIHALFISGAVFEPLGGIGKGLYLLGGGGLYIPRLTILGTLQPPENFIPALYYVILTALLVSGIVLWRIDRSPFGHALKAIRDNDTRATFIGLPVRRYRWYAFVLSALFVGLAGGLYGQLGRQITPEQLHWLFSAQLVLATVLGGTRSFLGPVLGAFAFVGLEEVSSWWIFGRKAIMGILLIAVVFAFPSGLIGAATAALRFLRRDRRH